MGFWDITNNLEITYRNRKGVFPICLLLRTHSFLLALSLILSYFFSFFSFFLSLSLSLSLPLAFFLYIFGFWCVLDWRLMTTRQICFGGFPIFTHPSFQFETPAWSLKVHFALSPSLLSHSLSFSSLSHTLWQTYSQTHKETFSITLLLSLSLSLSDKHTHTHKQTNTHTHKHT